MSTWTLEVLAPFTVQQHGQITTWQPGQRMTLPQDKAQRVLDHVGEKVRLLDDVPAGVPHTASQPLPPLLPGWLVVYYSATRIKDRIPVVYPLVGGCDDREHGTVQACDWDGVEWIVSLTDGTALPLSAIRGVAKTNQIGEVVAAWTTAAHGYDGAGC